MKEGIESVYPYFTSFKKRIDDIELPSKFTFPFYYEPHPLSVLAASELQEYLESQSDFEHNFGISTIENGLPIGKMFGVLVVENKAGKIGYLSAFSGKLAGQNSHSKFVPPVFDILQKDGFFLTREEHISSINAQIELLEQNPTFRSLKELVSTETKKSIEEINQARRDKILLKAQRKIRRDTGKVTLTESQFIALLEELGNESIRENYRLKDLIAFWDDRIMKLTTDFSVFSDKIELLKKERKVKSAALQQKIFDHYFFLNQAGENKSLTAIFEQTKALKPTAGVGECAAPKLLQYAFQNGMKPISLAEFWWGLSPKSEIRIHGHYYPACKSKCEPILGHMLAGIEMDENPMLSNPAEGKELSIVYEDDYLLVVNKPAEFLSVPGKVIDDSVLSRVKLLYPNATGPMVVHRLDMSTSGLMLVAKTLDIYKQLQRQFITRKIKKRYVAVLEGTVFENEGKIDLPLRLDIDNRPQQLVCYDFGKSALTNWKVLERKDGRTKIHFYPITGRTHQLRVHAAHSLGLNTPIVGDDIYGKKSERMLLHAEWIEFRHPVSQLMMEIEVAAEF